MRVAELCAGYGGLYQSMRLAGWPVDLSWVAEVDLDASAVLAAHHPDVPNIGDITTADFSAQEPVDVVAAGFPCQDVSSAGRRVGLVPGTRTGVWTHVARAIDTLRPKIVLLENVRGLLSARAHSDLEPCPWCVGDEPDEPALRALGAVLGDLAELGYDAVWQSVPAAAVGAPHLRWRVFIAAFPAADSASLGHGDAGPSRVGGVPSATVGGGVGADGLTLLPTPNAALGRGTGFPSEATAAERFGQGRRFLDDAVALMPTPRARDHKGRDPNPRGVDLNETVALLPTPRTSDTQGAGLHGDGGPDLRTAVSLLPTPTARDHKGHNQRGDETCLTGALLPTPRASDGTKGGPNQRGSSGDLMLPSAVCQLLPTPTAAHHTRNATVNRDPADDGHSGWTLNDVAHAARWGDYAPAIARWEHVMGRPAPDPTEPGSKGQPRLAPRFVEWMQGIDDGYVTSVVGRNAALRILGNGVVVQQGALALSLLAPHLPVFLPEVVAA